MLEAELLRENGRVIEALEFSLQQIGCYVGSSFDSSAWMLCILKKLWKLTFIEAYPLFGFLVPRG